MKTNTFTLLVKKELVDNRKPLLLGLIGIWATYILLGAFLGTVQMVVPAEIFIFLFFGGMILTIGASLAFNNMKTKEGRINSLMVPATMFQKYMVRWIAAVPILLLIVFLGCLLGDWTRILIFNLRGYDPTYSSYSADMTIFSFLSEQLSRSWQQTSFMICCVVVGLITSQSLYFLGAIVWPKLSFIKTWAVLQVLGMIVSTMLVILDFNHILSVHPKFYEMTFGWFLFIIYAFGALFCIGVYWLSYIRFKRSQVIYKLF